MSDAALYHVIRWSVRFSVSIACVDKVSSPDLSEKNTNKGVAQDTCNLVPQSHSSKKVCLLGQPVGTILGL